MNEQCGWKKFEQKQKKKSMKKLLEISIMDNNGTIQKREEKYIAKHSQKYNTMHDINDLSIFNKREKIREIEQQSFF